MAEYLASNLQAEYLAPNLQIIAIYRDTETYSRSLSQDEVQLFSVLGI